MAMFNSYVKLPEGRILPTDAVCCPDINLENVDNVEYMI